MVRPGPQPSGINRRDFLRTGTAAAGLSLLGANAAHARPGQARSVILLLLTGGPSQLDTWDPKPDAPAEVRGPFRAIQTSLPGVRVSEHFPRLATALHRCTLVRSLHHTAAPVHETGMQLLQTGRLQDGEVEHSHFGSALARELGGPGRDVPPFVILPDRLGNLGMNLGTGQTAGPLGDEYAPLILSKVTPAQGLDAGFARRALSLADQADAPRYGATALGRACLQARVLVEMGVRCVTVNMFPSVLDQVTWDCHADRRFLPGTLRDYADALCPTFDRAFTALVDDLHDRGLLDSTLVIATGEFGRTPYLNANGGRDHWTAAWSALLAGGGVGGGEVIGATDPLGGEPIDRPMRAEELPGIVYRAFGVAQG